MFGNVVYARLAARCPDEETRRKLDDELAAPPGGWDAADRDLMARMLAAAQERG